MSLDAVARWDKFEGPATYADLLPAGGLPVGWEVESEDAVRVLSRRVPPRYGEALRRLLLDARTPRQEDVAERMGLSNGAVSLMSTGSAAMLRADLEARR